MDNKYEVSIILIVYKTLEWIESCIRSIESQTFDNYELIIISNDDDIEIERTILKLTRGKSNVRYIHNTINVGGAEACNQGMCEAKGKYVFFMDSDDELPPRALENLINKADANDLDIVIGRGQILRNGKIRNVDYVPDWISWEQEIIVGSVSEAPMLTFNPYYWGRLYRREMLLDHNITMLPGAINADRNFNCKALLAAKSIGVCTQESYYWRKHNDDHYTSVTKGRMQQQNFLDRIRMMQETDELFKSAGNSSLYECSKICGLMRLLILAGDIEKDESFKELYYQEMTRYMEAFSDDEISECEYLTYRVKTLYYLLKNERFEDFERFAEKKVGRTSTDTGDRTIYEYFDMDIPVDFRTQYRFKIPIVTARKKIEESTVVVNASAEMWDDCEPIITGISVKEKSTKQEVMRILPLDAHTDVGKLSVCFTINNTELAERLSDNETYYFVVYYIIHSRVGKTKLTRRNGKTLHLKLEDISKE